VNRLRFQRSVYTVLRLSEEEVEALTNLCETHFDKKVRSLSIGSGPDAILSAARAELVWDKTQKQKGPHFVILTVGTQQLVHLAKAAETFGSRKGDPSLYKQIEKLKDEAHAEWVRLNPDAERNAASKAD
jgi:hypothetical protein